MLQLWELKNQLPVTKRIAGAPYLDAMRCHLIHTAPPLPSSSLAMLYACSTHA